MAAIVLAGGRSVRMGQPKGHLILETDTNRSMHDWVLENAQEVTTEIVVVGGDTGISGTGMRSVPDDYPGQGPLGGLITGMRQIHLRRAVLLAIDMPFVAPEIVRMLAAYPSGGDVVAVRREGADGGLQPFVAVYEVSCLPHLEVLWENGVRSLGQMMKSLTVTVVPSSVIEGADPGYWSWFNVNTPEDFMMARARATAIKRLPRA